MIPREKRRYWYAGTALAVAGVGVANVVSGWIAPPGRDYLHALGVALALGGLFVILMGTRRKA